MPQISRAMSTQDLDSRSSDGGFVRFGS